MPAAPLGHSLVKNNNSRENNMREELKNSDGIMETKSTLSVAQENSLHPKLAVADLLPAGSGDVCVTQRPPSVPRAASSSNELGSSGNGELQTPPAPKRLFKKSSVFSGSFMDLRRVDSSALSRTASSLSLLSILSTSSKAALPGQPALRRSSSEALNVDTSLRATEIGCQDRLRSRASSSLTDCPIYEEEAMDISPRSQDTLDTVGPVMALDPSLAPLVNAAPSAGEQNSSSSAALNSASSGFLVKTKSIWKRAVNGIARSVAETQVASVRSASRLARASSSTTSSPGQEDSNVLLGGLYDFQNHLALRPLTQTMSHAEREKSQERGVAAARKLSSLRICHSTGSDEPQSSSSCSSNGSTGSMNEVEILAERLAKSASEQIGTRISCTPITKSVDPTTSSPEHVPRPAFGFSGFNRPSSAAEYTSRAHEQTPSEVYHTYESKESSSYQMVRSQKGSFVNPADDEPANPAEYGHHDAPQHRSKGKDASFKSDHKYLVARLRSRGAALTVSNVARHLNSWINKDEDSWFLASRSQPYCLTPQAEAIKRDLFYGDRRPKIPLDKYLARIVRYIDAYANDKISARSTGIGCLVGACTLLRRMAAVRDFELDEMNVHRVAMSACLVTFKLLEDESCTNTFFAGVAGVDLVELNRLEVTFCRVLNFKLMLCPQEFVDATAVFSGTEYGRHRFRGATEEFMCAGFASAEQPSVFSQ